MNRSCPLWSVERDDGGCMELSLCTEDEKTIIILYYVLKMTKSYVSSSSVRGLMHKKA